MLNFTRDHNFTHALHVMHVTNIMSGLGLSWSVLVCFGLPWSTLICLGLLGLFQITIERLKCSKAISGRMGWDWVGNLCRQ